MDKNDFFAALQLKTAPLPVELPGGSDLVLQELGSDDMSDYVDFRAAGNSRPATNAFLIVRSVYTVGGERFFKDADIERIVRLPSHITSKLITAINAVSGDGSDNDGEHEKNSEAATGGAST